jgi:hypothetical protein
VYTDLTNSNELLLSLLIVCTGVTQSALVMLAISGSYMALIPLNRACRESIWQRKVPADLQVCSGKSQCSIVAKLSLLLSLFECLMMLLVAIFWFLHCAVAVTVCIASASVYHIQ